MSTQPAITEGTSDVTRQTHSASLPQRGFRMAMLVVTFAVCCYAAYGLGRWWALARHATQPIETHLPDATNFDPLLAAALPLGGQWAFDEVEWSIKSELIAIGALEAAFEELGKSPLSKMDPQLPNTDPELIDLIAAMQIRPIKRAGDEVYRVDRPDLRAELITRKVAEQSKTVAFAMAYPAGDDTWQLYLATPKQTAADQSLSAAPHLLPLPAGASRSGGRFAGDGRVLLELISLDSTTEKLLADWRAAGWEIRSSGIANPSDFSVLCARGNEVVYAWSADPHDSLKNLMLVRTPATADTSP